MMIRNLSVINTFLLLIVLLGCAAKQAVTVPPPDAIVAEAPKMVVGDKWIFMENDMFTDKYTKFTEEISVVNKDGSYKTLYTRLEDNYRIQQFYDNLGRIYAAKNFENEEEIPGSTPPFLTKKFPLWVGKEWKTGKRQGWNFKNQRYYTYTDSFKVIAYEKVETKAGNLWAYRLRRFNYNHDSGRMWIATYWYSPDVKFWVKYSCEWGSKFELLEFIPGK